MHFFDGLHECSDAAVTASLISEFDSLGKHSVELSNFVRKPDSLEKNSNFISWSGEQKVVFRNAHFLIGRGEQ